MQIFFFCWSFCKASMRLYILFFLFLWIIKILSRVFKTTSYRHLMITYWNPPAAPSRMTPADYVVGDSGTSKEACAPNIRRWSAPRAGLLFWTFLVFARTKQHRLRLGGYHHIPSGGMYLLPLLFALHVCNFASWPHTTVVIRIEGTITITTVLLLGRRL